VSATREITLPHGLWDGRRRRSAAELRPPTGADEAYLLSAGGLSRAEQVTGLLGRCVVRVDELPAGDDLARALTVGDREALLLHLRADAFGDSLACTLECPECGERMDVDLRVSDLLVAPYAEVRDRHEVELDVDGVRREAVVRLATGADQEAVARHEDRAAGLEELVERCVLELRAADEPPLPLALAEALSDPLAGLDPQAEITIDAVCPSCGEPLSGLVDAASVLLAELTATDERLLREVDAIARVYHWGEDEILGLDVHRRRRYLELLAETEFETEAEGP
jgi:hypothetical protein